MVVNATAASEYSIPQPRQKLAKTWIQAVRLRCDPFKTIPRIAKARLAIKGYCMVEATLFHDEAKTAGLRAVPPGPEYGCGPKISGMPARVALEISPTLCSLQSI